MKKVTKIALAGALSLGLAFGAAPAIAPQTVPVASAEMAAGHPSKPFEINFKDVKNGVLPDTFLVVDGYTNGSYFNVFWHKQNVTFNNGRMQITVDKDKIGNNAGIPYSSGEFRTSGFYGYGRFEIRSKAIKAPGVVTTFFTYTGEHDNNPTDVIEMVVLGKDPTKIKLNYTRDGNDAHAEIVDLGFDASQGFHTYAFEWHKDSLAWFVDGKQVRKVTADIPKAKPRVMTNVWIGKDEAEDELGTFNGSGLPLVAEYEFMKFTPFPNE